MTVVSVSPIVPRPTAEPRPLDRQLRLTNTTGEPIDGRAIAGRARRPVCIADRPGRVAAQHDRPSRAADRAGPRSSRATRQHRRTSSRPTAPTARPARRRHAGRRHLHHHDEHDRQRRRHLPVHAGPTAIYPLYFTRHRSTGDGRARSLGGAHHLPAALLRPTPQPVGSAGCGRSSTGRTGSADDTVFTDDDLADSVATGGRLDRALAGRRGRRRRRAADPGHRPRAARRARGHGDRATPSGPARRPRPGTGRAAAAAWLARLRTVLATIPTSTSQLTPYADPDVESLDRGRPHLGDDAARSRWRPGSARARRPGAADRPRLAGRPARVEPRPPCDALARPGVTGVLLDRLGRAPEGRPERRARLASRTCRTADGGAGRPGCTSARRSARTPAPAMGRPARSGLPDAARRARRSAPPQKPAVAARRRDRAAALRRPVTGRRPPPRSGPPAVSASPGRSRCTRRCSARTRTADDRRRCSRPRDRRRRCRRRPPGSRARGDHRPAGGHLAARRQRAGRRAAGRASRSPSSGSSRRPGSRAPDLGTVAGRAARRRRCTRCSPACTSSSRRPTAATRSRPATRRCRSPSQNDLPYPVRIRVHVTTVNGLPGFTQRDPGRVYSHRRRPARRTLQIPAQVDRPGRIRVAGPAAHRRTAPRSARRSRSTCTAPRSASIGVVITVVAGAVLCHRAARPVLPPGARDRRRHRSAKATGARPSRRRSVP